VITRLEARTRLEQMMLKIGRGLVLDRESILLVLALIAGHLSIVSENPPFAPVQIVSALGT
jgi:hypothetical protein